MRSGLKCLYSNADQLLNKIEDLKALIAKEKPDIMLITEVIPKAQKNEIYETQMKIPGYETHCNFKFTENNLGASGKRGVAIYVKDDIKSDEVTIKKEYGDQMWIRIKLKGKDSLLIGCLYRSPTNDLARLNETTEEICKIIEEATSQNSTHLLICGDFNYPNIDWENDYVDEASPIRRFIDTIQSTHLHQHVSQPTRYRHDQEPSLLDLILTNEEGMLQNLSHNPGLGESDHECLNFDLCCYKVVQEKSTLPNFHKGNYATIRDRICDLDWVTKLQGDFETAYPAFMEILETAMDGCIPSFPSRKQRRNIYLTMEAVRAVDKKNKLWKRYKLSKSGYDRLRFVRAKNDLRRLTRKLRFDFEKRIARDAKIAPKKFWAYVNSRTKTRPKVPSLERKDKSLASTDTEKAEVLNTFFASTFTKEDLTNIPDMEDSPFTGECLNTFVITPEMVLKKLQDLNPGKTPGPDGWHPIFLKNIADLISLPLSILFQKSLDEGLLPPDWLKAIVTAIHKKGKKNLPENYRPVSITSIICKLMESIVRDRVVEHMERNHLFSKKQHGFVPRRNCMTNLLVCMEKWTEILDDGDAIDVIYTDFSKAFDSVPHQRLLKKLENLGIIGNTLGWIEEFLSNRVQRVRIESKFSSWEKVTSGIPQGSVLGPILFVVFINDMPNVVDSLCQLFADDAKLFRNVNLRENENTSKLQVDINNMTEWSTKWQLLFNTGKCKVLHIGNNNPNHRYKMNGQKLEQIEEEKDLGVIVDNKLKFHKQTSAAVKKANSRLGLIKKSFAVLDHNTLPLLYNPLVRSHLEYGNVIWGPFYKGDIEAVERVQRRATKLVQPIRELSYEDRLRYLGLPSLQHRRRRGDMIYTYKIFTGVVDINKDDFFETSTSSTRGHRYKIMKKRAIKASRVNTFSNRVIDDWNSLPKQVVTAETVNKFKERLDAHWSDEIYATPF